MENSAHPGSLPIKRDRFGSQHVKGVGVDESVPPDGGIHVFHQRASFEHTHLFALQARLLTNFCMCLFVWWPSSSNKPLTPAQRA